MVAEVERLSAIYRDGSQPRAASSKSAVAAYLAYRWMALPVAILIRNQILRIIMFL